MFRLAYLPKMGEALISRPAIRWLALLLVSIAIILTAIQSYREIDKELTAVTLSRREAVVQLAATTLAEKFGRLVDIAISLTTRPKLPELVAQGKWIEASGYLRTVPRDLPIIERLFLADVEGTLKVDMPELPGARGVNFAHREWFQGVSQDWRPYVSPVYIRSAAPRIKVFAVAIPIRNEAGLAVGILVLQIRIENMLEWISEMSLIPQGFLYIVDQQGQIAFHSGYPDRQEITDLSGTPIMEKLRSGKAGVEIGYDAMQREEAITAHATVPGYGWGVVAHQPARTSIGLAARDEQLRRLLLGYGLIALLCGSAIFMASRIAVDRRRAEEDRRMKEELERRVTERTRQLTAANKELEAFSYSVSHDLRAPLRSIDGFSQALLEDHQERLDDQGKNYLQRVRAATQRMGELIDDLLKLSRVTRMEMHSETVDLSALAESVIRDLRRADPRRQVDVSIQPGLRAAGDPRLLQIMLVNLLSNAWKFTGRQPDARIEVGSRNDSDGTTFYVRDNGVGFDMAYSGKLFGAFQRLHAVSEFPGTGIGLATVQRIIHRHNGSIRAEGESGKGACFYFTLDPSAGSTNQEEAA